MFPGGQLVRRWSVQQTGCHKQNVQGHPVCLVHGDVASDMTVNALRRAAAGAMNWGRRSKCSAVDVDDNGAVETPGGEMREHTEWGSLMGRGTGRLRRSVGFCHDPEWDRDNISADLRGVLLKRSSVSGRPLEKRSGSSQGWRVGALKSGDMLKRQAGRPASP